MKPHGAGRRWRRVDGTSATGQPWPSTGGSVTDVGFEFLASGWRQSLVWQKRFKTEAAAKRAVERWLSTRTPKKRGKR